MTRRYPTKIGTITTAGTNTAEQSKFLHQSIPLGEVDVCQPFDDPRLIAQLERLCKQNGFAFNKQHPGPYGARDSVFGAGSVGFHDDTGLGYTVSVLLACAPLSRGLKDSGFLGDRGSADCIFISGTSVLYVSIGDVFIFNGNIEHAWMSNGKWLLLSQSVRKLRRAA
jgi:hypothetical protein